MDSWWKGKWGKDKKLSSIQMALLFFLLIGFLILSGGKKDATVVIQEPPVEESRDAQEDVSSEDILDNEKKEEEPEEIFVHVSGQVHRPGVICLPTGSRVYEALEQAGGMTADGDLESINLAAVLMDQQKVVVGSLSQKQELLASGLTPSTSTPETVVDPQNTGTIAGIININTATKEQLESLPGIGPVIAQNIIDYRQQHGAFKNIEDIKSVNRIGEATFANICDQIGVR